MAGCCSRAMPRIRFSPFGARGANSGIQDVDNLAWKTGAGAGGACARKPAGQLRHDAERVFGADENIWNSACHRFHHAKTPVSKLFRNAVLRLAETVPFARTVVNSGRLSLPCTYDGSALNGADHAAMPARTRPGAPCPDAPLGGGGCWRNWARVLRCSPSGWMCLRRLRRMAWHCLAWLARTPEVAARYLGEAEGAVYLIRPDQHVAARWDHFEATEVAAALGRALGKV